MKCETQKGRWSGGGLREEVVTRRMRVQDNMGGGHEEN